MHGISYSFKHMRSFLDVRVQYWRAQQRRALVDRMWISPPSSSGYRSLKSCTKTCTALSMLHFPSYVVTKWFWRTFTLLLFSHKQQPPPTNTTTQQRVLRRFTPLLSAFTKLGGWHVYISRSVKAASFLWPLITTHLAFTYSLSLFSSKDEMKLWDPPSDHFDHPFSKRRTYIRRLKKGPSEWKQNQLRGQLNYEAHLWDAILQGQTTLLKLTKRK